MQLSSSGLKTKFREHGRNFVVKCWENSLVLNQYSHQVNAEVKFYKYRFPILFFRRVLRATLITLCYILTNDCQINILTFVTGHRHTVLYFNNMISIPNFDKRTA